MRRWSTWDGCRPFCLAGDARARSGFVYGGDLWSASHVPPAAFGPVRWVRITQMRSDGSSRRGPRALYEDVCIDVGTQDNRRTGQRVLLDGDREARPGVFLPSSAQRLPGEVSQSINGSEPFHNKVLDLELHLATLVPLIDRRAENDRTARAGGQMLVPFRPGSRRWPSARGFPA